MQQHQDKTLGRILIVDDNPKNIQVAASVLAQSDLEIEFALDADSGMNWLKNSSIDLVLLDIMMPGIDGYEFCKRIKQEKDLQEIPIIFLTAKNDRESVIKGFDVGAEDYITKPFDGRELVSRVKIHLELKKSRAELKEINTGLQMKIDERTHEIKEAYNQLQTLNQQLKDSNNELLAIDKSKHNFLNIIGQEVGMALNEVTGLLQVLKHRVDSKKDTQLIDSIDNSMIKLETFVKSALRITNLQSKGITLNPQNVNLSSIIGYCLLRLDEKIRTNKTRFRTIDLNKSLNIKGEQTLLTGGILSFMEFLITNSTPESVVAILCTDQQTGFIDLEFSISDKMLTSIFEQEKEKQKTHYENLDFHAFNMIETIVKAHSGSIILQTNNKIESRCIMRFPKFTN